MALKFRRSKDEGTTTTTTIIKPRGNTPNAREPNARERITPQALEAEQSTLGAMIIQREAIVRAVEILNSDDFYREVHRKIFNLIVTLFEIGQPVDFITVVEEARRGGQLEEIGGAAYLQALVESCPAAAHVESYAGAVLETSLKRMGIMGAEQLAHMSYNGNTSGDIVEFLRAQLEQLESRHHSRHTGPEIFTAEELMAMDLPDPRWALPDLIPEGLTIFAGKPKLGKSYFMLNVAVAVAAGGHALGTLPVEQGDVLYMGLEDTKRRLKRRLSQLMQGQPVPARLSLSTQWNRLDDGGLSYIERWLEAHPEARMVVIDTFKKVRPTRPRSESYGDDYDDIGRLKELADQYGVAVVVIHHVRKLEAEDPIEAVSGTMGLTGAADSILVLNRRRGQHNQEAMLFTSGRDMDETEYALNWDPQLGIWTILGDNEEVRTSKDRQEVIDILKANIAPMHYREIAELTDRSPGAARKLLWTMANDGLLHKLEEKDGWYQFLQIITGGNPGSGQSSSNSTNNGNNGNNGNTRNNGNNGNSTTSPRGPVTGDPQEAAHSSLLAFPRSQTPDNPVHGEPYQAPSTAAPTPAPEGIMPVTSASPVTTVTPVTAVTANTPEAAEHPADEHPPAKHPADEQSEQDVLRTIERMCDLALESVHWKDRPQQLVDFYRWWKRQFTTPLTPELFDHYFPQWQAGEIA